MHCPHCHDISIGSKVIDTTHDSRGGIRRRRECKICKQRFSTYETPILASPLVIKENGAREDFNIDKLLRGIRLACVKRPVSAADIDRLAGEIEAKLQNMGKREIQSRIIGDMVIEGLKEIDHIAYIRFALVYLGLDDLDAIRNELDRLMEN
jgi:transcriptional repressor NrdR